MTDTVNLRRLASQLRREKHTEVPDEKVLLSLCRSLGIGAWAEELIRQNHGSFVAMLAFHMMDAGDAT